MNPVLEDNIQCLQQGLELLSRLDEAQYTQSCKICFGSSIGGHMRHNIDHYQSFLKEGGTGEVDYDARLRGTSVEQVPAKAVEAIQDIVKGLAAMAAEDTARTLRIKMDSGSSVDEADAWSQSTLKRELQFLLSHTIHHFALIGVICQSQGIEIPEHFGVAPSTLKYRETTNVACVQ